MTEEDFDLRRQMDEEFTGVDDKDIKGKIKFYVQKFLPTNVETDLCCGLAVGIIFLGTGLLLLIAIIINAVHYTPAPSAKRISGAPLIYNPLNSEFVYNGFPGLLQIKRASQELFLGLVTTSYNIDPSNPGPYNVLPSYITYSESHDGFAFPKIYNNESLSILVKPNKPWNNAGASNARIILYNDVYYMFYTATSNNSNTLSSTVALAKCNKTGEIEQEIVHCFKDQGPLNFNARVFSIFLKPWSLPHIFFFGKGDKNLYVGYSQDLVSFNASTKILLSSVPGNFDQDIMEPGPEPLQLSNGYWIMLYNGGKYQTGPSPRPGYNLVYSIGYVIFDETANMVYRSTAPVLEPKLDWELCNGTTKGYSPKSVYATGWMKTSVDRFQVYYSACDSYVGVADLKVDFV